MWWGILWVVETAALQPNALNPKPYNGWKLLHYSQMRMLHSRACKVATHFQMQHPRCNSKPQPLRSEPSLDNSLWAKSIRVTCFRIEWESFLQAQLNLNNMLIRAKKARLTHGWQIVQNIVLTSSAEAPALTHMTCNLSNASFSPGFAWTCSHAQMYLSLSSCIKFFDCLRL